MTTTHHTYDDTVRYVSTAKDERWIRHALCLAASSRHRNLMGALAVQGGRVVAHAVNRRRNTPANVDWTACSFHAEEGLVRARPRLHGVTVYVARITASGVPGLARPCARCHLLLTEAGVRRTVWTAGGDRLGVERHRGR